VNSPSLTIAELAKRSRLPIDTIRYYQGLGLLDAPRRRGRIALYGEAHLKRLKLIRSMARRGLPLKVIKDLIVRPAKRGMERALRSAVEQETDRARYTSAEFAEMLGVPRGLLDLVEGCALREVLKDQGGAILYSDADLEAARGVMQILGHGIPVTRLLSLALRHHSAVLETVDEAIDLFNEYVRGAQRDANPEAVAESFRAMLPLVVSLVGHHFYRLLVSRALARLRQSGDEQAFQMATREAASIRLPLAQR
jgi:DNA-binding transcriptional MerR regulator